MFNPKLEVFLKENKDISVIGLYWAGLWRLYAVAFGIGFALTIIGAMID
jgi:hypothetical protein